MLGSERWTQLSFVSGIHEIHDPFMAAKILEVRYPKAISAIKNMILEFLEAEELNFKWAHHRP